MIFVDISIGTWFTSVAEPTSFGNVVVTNNSGKRQKLKESTSASKTSRSDNVF